MAVIPAGAAEAETSENLIINGDIEGELNGSWYWSPGKTQEYKYEGESALIISGGNNPWQNVFQKVTVKPYTSYTFSFWYYLPDGANWRTNWYINGVPADLDGSNPVGYFENIASTISAGSVENCEEGVWKQASAAFDSGTNEAVLIDFYSGGDSKPIRFYVDNVSLTENENSDNGKIVKNGGFENGSEFWNTGGGEISKEEHYEGTASLKLATKMYNKATQKLSVKANTDYVISYYHKGNKYSRWGVSATEGQVEADSRIVGGDIYNTNGEWVRTSAFFNSGENTIVYFNIMSGSDDIEIYIDNVSLDLVAAGDANGDGLINVVDLTVLKQVLLGFNTNHSTVGCRVRGEDECDIRDLIRLKKELA